MAPCDSPRHQVELESSESKQEHHLQYSLEAGSLNILAGGQTISIGGGVLVFDEEEFVSYAGYQLWLKEEAGQLVVEGVQSSRRLLNETEAVN